MKMSLIVLGALAVSFLLRRRSAALRHWVLAVGVACAAAMPILTSALPAWPLPFATPTAFTPYENPFRDSRNVQCVSADHWLLRAAAEAAPVSLAAPHAGLTAGVVRSIRLAGGNGSSASRSC